MILWCYEYGYHPGGKSPVYVSLTKPYKTRRTRETYYAVIRSLQIRTVQQYENERSFDEDLHPTAEESSNIEYY